MTMQLFKLALRATLLFSISINTALANDPAATAMRIVERVNSRDFAGLWEMTSPASKDVMEAQLNNVKSQPHLKKLVADTYAIAINSIESMDAKEYYIALISSEIPSQGENRTTITRVTLDAEGHYATVVTSTNDVEGKFRMSLVDGRWYMSF